MLLSHLKCLRADHFANHGRHASRRFPVRKNCGQLRRSIPKSLQEEMEADVGAKKKNGPEKIEGDERQVRLKTEEREGRGILQKLRIGRGEDSQPGERVKEQERSQQPGCARRRPD